MVTRHLRTVALNNIVTNNSRTSIVFPHTVRHLLQHLTARVRISTNRGYLVSMALAATNTPTSPPGRHTAFGRRELTTRSFLRATNRVTQTRQLTRQASRTSSLRIIKVGQTFSNSIRLTNGLRIITSIQIRIRQRIMQRRASIILRRNFRTTLLRTNSTQIFTLPRVTIVRRRRVDLNFRHHVRRDLTNNSTTSSTRRLQATLSLRTIKTVVNGL